MIAIYAMENEAPSFPKSGHGLAYMSLLHPWETCGSGESPPSPDRQRCAADSFLLAYWARLWDLPAADESTRPFEQDAQTDG